MKLIVIVGARPQFIKLAGLLPALLRRFEVVVVHTGQHYDENLSQRFFAEFDLPRPQYSLDVGSGSHGVQTGRMLERLDPILEKERPEMMVVFGDTNSTLAGALAAAKMNIPVGHVEAGLRSFSKIPEEINRILTDRISDILFTPSQVANDNLQAEGITDEVHLVGDVMLDVAAAILQRNQGAPPVEGEYGLLTLHRAGNTDDPERLKTILETVARSPYPVIFPCHPRTRAAAARHNLTHLLEEGALQPREPVGYTTMLSWLRGAKRMLTDSGGIQKEAYFLGVPCLTLRPNTEWVETVRAGWNRLVDADGDAISGGLREFPLPPTRPPLYGNGCCAARIAEELERFLRRR